MATSERESPAGYGQSAGTAAQAQAPAAQGDTIARGATLAFAAKIAGGVFTAAITIFLARQLGSASYGVFALSLSIVGLVELPSDFGVAVSLPRFLAEHRDDPARLREYVQDGIRLEAIGSCVVAAGLVVAAGPLARAYHAPALTWPLRALAIALIGQNYLFLFSGVFSALRQQAANLWSGVAESAAELVATLALVLTFGGVAAAAAARATGYAFGAIVGLVLTLRLLDRGVLPRTPRVSPHGRRIVSYAARLWLIDGVYTMFTQIDSLLIGAFLTAGSVSFFSAPMRLITVLGYPGYAIASAVSPRLARTGSGPPEAGAFAGAIRLLTAVMVLAVTFTTVWAAPIIHITLGTQFAPAGPVLRTLAPLVLLTGYAALVSTALNYLGSARRRIPIAVATLAVNVVVDVILIPRIGVVGGAVGSDAGMAVYVLGQLYFCNTELNLGVGPQLAGLLRCLFAAAPPAILLALLGTHHVPVRELVAGGFGAAALYLVGLVLTRTVELREVRAVIAQLGGRVRHLRR